MIYLSSRCPNCKGALLAAGYACMCVAPIAYHVPKLDAEVNATALDALHSTHIELSEIERKFPMCPIAKAIGGYVLEADPLAFRLILVDSLNTAAA